MHERAQSQEWWEHLFAEIPVDRAAAILLDMLGRYQPATAEFPLPGIKDDRKNLEHALAAWAAVERERTMR